jgi:hypothetical protein
MIKINSESDDTVTVSRTRELYKMYVRIGIVDIQFTAEELKLRIDYVGYAALAGKFPGPIIGTENFRN